MEIIGIYFGSANLTDMSIMFTASVNIIDNNFMRCYCYNKYMVSTISGLVDCIFAYDPIMKLSGVNIV